MSRAYDVEVLALAASENRVLLTFDKDFGWLAKVARLPPPAGIVLFRLPLSRLTEVGCALADSITSRDDWEGQFAVVEPGRVRIRPLDR